jgi:hypothetical protein
MQGLAAIEAANGWVITLAGSGIVFVGLVVLAILISSLEKALQLWDKKVIVLKGLKKRFVSEPAEAANLNPHTCPNMASQAEKTELKLSHSDYEAALYFDMLIKRLGEPISLSSLLEHAEKRGIHKPHSHLDTLLKLDLISECTGEQKGFYHWRRNVRLMITSDDQ